MSTDNVIGIIYGVIAFFSLLAGMVILGHEAKRQGLDSEDTGFGAIVTAVMAAAWPAGWTIVLCVLLYRRGAQLRDFSLLLIRSNKELRKENAKLHDKMDKLRLTIEDLQSTNQRLSEAMVDHWQGPAITAKSDVKFLTESPFTPQAETQDRPNG